MEPLINALGVLGAYFAVLLVLSVAVESLLDLVKLGGLLRARISPEQAMKDIKDWLPPGSNKAAVQVAAITNMVSEFQVQGEKIEDAFKKVKSLTDNTANALGLGGQVQDTEKQLAAALYEIRKKYEDDEARRIGVLRVLAAVLGIVIAIPLGIDTFNLLAALFPKPFLDFLNGGTPLASITHLGGMLLSGFAASAGSSFWHDQLARVRAAKEAAQNLQQPAQ